VSVPFAFQDTFTDVVGCAARAIMNSDLQRIAGKRSWCNLRFDVERSEENGRGLSELPFSRLRLEPGTPPEYKEGVLTLLRWTQPHRYSLTKTKRGYSHCTRNRKQHSPRDVAANLNLPLTDQAPLCTIVNIQTVDSVTSRNIVMFIFLCLGTGKFASNLLSASILFSHHYVL
jgi:hypothetical protein